MARDHGFFEPQRPRVLADLTDLSGWPESWDVRPEPCESWRALGGVAAGLVAHVARQRALRLEAAERRRADFRDF